MRRLGSVRKALFGALVGGVVLGSAACSGGGAQEESSEGQTAAGQADTERMTVAMVTHSPPGDLFWDMVRKGAESAAAKDNVDLQYVGDPDPAKQATLVQTAIDKGVDGIAVSLPAPDALADSVAAAQEAGIPVVVVNAGLDDWQEMGALAFFGLDIQASGVLSGQQLAEAGGKRGICVNQAAGVEVLNQLCEGASQGFGGDMEMVQVNGEDEAAVRSTLQAKLAQDKSIDSIVTLNAPIGVAAVDAAEAAGSAAKITTLNVTPDVVEAIKADKILSAIDQQGWLQGYEAVDSLWLYKTNLNILGSGQPVLTGPTLVNADNIDQIAPLVEKGTR